MILALYPTAIADFGGNPIEVSSGRRAPSGRKMMGSWFPSGAAFRRVVPSFLFPSKLPSFLFPSKLLSLFRRVVPTCRPYIKLAAAAAAAPAKLLSDNQLGICIISWPQQRHRCQLYLNPTEVTYFGPKPIIISINLVPEKMFMKALTGLDRTPVFML